MATAAGIPSELFQHILWHVGEPGWVLREFGSQDRRNTISHLASCSLTCVYWARACRPKVFKHIRIQSLDNLRGLSSLILNTPQRFTPVSEYIQYAQLIQKLDERSWLQTIPLQSSYALGVLRSAFKRAYVEIRIVGSSPADHHGKPLTTPLLFAGLPRSLPAHLLQCDTALLQDCHFRTLSEFKRLILTFDGSTAHQFRLRVVNCTWANRTRVSATLFAARPLKFPTWQTYFATIDCPDNVEATWEALGCGEQICRRLNPIDLPSPISLHRSDQRVIYATMNILHQSAIPGKSTDRQDFMFSTGSTWTFQEFSYETMCSLHVYRKPSMLRFTFYTYRGHGRTTPAHITLVQISLPSRTRDEKTTTSTAYAETYPWDQVVDLLNSLPALVRTHFAFKVRDDLVQFVEARRFALAKLLDRIELVYEVGPAQAQIVDFGTLENIGNIIPYELPHW